MHPVLRTAIYTFLAFAAIVALAYVNRDRINRHFGHLQANYYQQTQR